jgi:hypothetical protein
VSQPAPSSNKTARKLLLRILLAFLVLTALIAIIDVWTDVDEDGRILVSSFIISVASLLGLTGAAQLDRSPRAPVGLATLGLAGLAAVLSLILVWGDVRDDELFKFLASAWLWALSTSLHSLIGLALLPADKRWLVYVAPVATHAATAWATALLFEAGGDDETSYYLLATLYILATLASLAVLIVHLMHRQERRSGEEVLKLISVEGSVYRDAHSGQRYRVTPLK